MKILSNLFFAIILISLNSCTYKVEELKFDPRGKVVIFNIGKQDTIFFAENSAQIDSVYSLSLRKLKDFVVENNHKIFILSNTHEEEKESISTERIDEVANYFINLGLKKEQILKDYKIKIIPISQDDTLTEEEKKPVRRVILQIVK